MNKIIAVILTLCTVFALAGCGETESAEKTGVTLNVYNWGENISDGTDGCLDVIEMFEKETGIEVNYTTYPTNEEMYNKIKTGGVSYDIVIPSDYMIGRMIKEDMLEKLNFENIPNYSLIDDKYKSGATTAHDPNCEYSVPYTSGRVALIYNKSYIKETVDSWEILWNDKYKNNILMFDNPRDAFGIAELALGKSLNTESTDDLEATANKLKAQKSVSPVYAMDQIMEKMPSGEAYVAPYYVGDCVNMYADAKEYGEDLGIVIPKEGTNLFVDAMCIPKGSAHKKEAEQFINFMLRTDVALANIEYIAYTSPQKEAAAQHKQQLVEEFGIDIASLVYPDDLGKVEMFKTLSDEANQKMIDLWTDVKK